jgi:hypothetical protein
MVVEIPLYETPEEEESLNPFYDNTGFSSPIALKSIEKGEPFSENLPFLKKFFPDTIEELSDREDRVAIRLNGMPRELGNSKSDILFSTRNSAFGGDGEIEYYLQLRAGARGENSDAEAYKGAVLSALNAPLESSSIKGYNEINYYGLNLKVAFPFKRAWENKESKEVGKLPKINGELFSTDMSQGLNVQFTLIPNNYNTNIGFFLEEGGEPEVLKFIKTVTDIPCPRYFHFHSGLKSGYDRGIYSYYTMEIGV